MATSTGSGDYDVVVGPYNSNSSTIIATGHTVTLTDNVTGNNFFQIQAGATLVGGGFSITVDNESSSDLTFLNNGTISGVLDVIITNPNGVAALDFTGQGGNVRNLTINHASCVATIQDDTTLDGNLTITAGEFNTKSGSNHALTVAGALANDGTLTLNGSTVNLGSTSTEAGDVTGSGTFNLDTSTINYHTAGGANFVPSTSANFDTNTSTFNLIGLNGSNRAHNFTFASGNMHNITTSRGAGTDTHTDTLNGNTTITGDLTVGANSNFSTGSRVFTVNGNVEVTGQLICNGSDKPMTFGSLGIDTGGTYNATSGTTTLTDGGTVLGQSSTVLFGEGTFTHNNGTLVFDSTQYRIPAGGTFYNVKMTGSHITGGLYGFGGTLLPQPVMPDGTTEANAVSILGTLEITDDDFRPYNINKIYVHNLVIGDGTGSANSAKFDMSTNDLFDGKVFVDNVTIHSDGQLLFGDGDETSSTEGSSALNIYGAFRNLGGSVDIT